MKIKIKTLKNKADKLFQILGRLMYSNCAISNKPMDCLHHYVPKSQSLNLRWDIYNGVPIRTEDHQRVHRAFDPIDILNMTNFMKVKWGLEWEDYIRENKHKVFKPTISRMREIIAQLESEIKKYQ